MRVARSKHVTVVYNPVKVDLGRLRRALERSVSPGARVTWSATSAEDPGYAQASRALEDGADLIVAAGGDGTVRMVALAVSGSHVPMAIVPAGTGNMLARNLGIPLALEPAVRRALSGRERVIDLCPKQHVFRISEIALSEQNHLICLQTERKRAKEFIIISLIHQNGLS